MTSRSIFWWVLSVLGAVLGGGLGYYIHVWLVETHGLLALMLPGGMIGLGAGLFVRRRSYLFAALCALGAFFLGLYAEWHFWPFIKDESFAYLVAHFYLLKPFHLALIILGSVLCFWFALGYLRGESRGNSPPGPR